MTRAERNHPRAKLAIAPGGAPGVALVDLRGEPGKIAFLPSPAWAGAPQGYTWVSRVKAPVTIGQREKCIEAYHEAERRYGALRLVKRVSKRGQPWLFVD